VRAFVAAGADVEEVGDEQGRTPVFMAVQQGELATLVYLVEECGASLRHVANDGMHQGAYRGRLDVVRYVYKKAPELIDAPDNGNITPIMTASGKGETPVVRHLARLGCSLSRKDNFSFTALDYARHYDQHDTARLLTDIDSAGGWRPYAAACRMAYVRIRYEVSKTYAVLDEGHGVLVPGVRGTWEGETEVFSADQLQVQR